MEQIKQGFKTHNTINQTQKNEAQKIDLRQQNATIQPINNRCAISIKHKSSVNTSYSINKQKVSRKMWKILITGTILAYLIKQKTDVLLVKTPMNAKASPF